MTAIFEQVVAEALSWRGTPYHKSGLLKGIGVDCGTFPFLVYVACGIIPKEEGFIFHDHSVVPPGHDWFCNTDEEKYSKAVLRYFDKIISGMSYPRFGAQPGHLVLTRGAGSKRFNHSGVVIKWPTIIHCTSDGGVRLDDASTHWLWGFREVEVYDPFHKR